MSQDFDLFGDPIPEGWGRRGRPPHTPTDATRKKVVVLLAFGWNNERIAKSLAITPPTLRKNYFRELKFRQEARDRVEAGLALSLWNLAKDGNVAAAKEFRKVMERNDLMGQHLADHGLLGDKPIKAAKLGKKEKALLAARSPDTDTTLGELMAERQEPKPTVN